MISYDRNPRFIKQLKKLIKKYRTLEDDLAIAQIAAIELFHIHAKDNGAVRLVPSYDLQEVKIYKIVKFACKSLVGKGVRSGIRVVYAYFPDKSHVEYLEIYYKEKDDTDMDYDFAKEFIKKYKK